VLALQAVAVALVILPFSYSSSVHVSGGYAADVAVTVLPLNLNRLQLADFGDVENAR
jgi:hypothetical protein